MARTPNPPAFDDAVRAYLADKREQFNYEQMLLTFLDNDRFHRWAQVVAAYRPLDGVRFLSSGCGFGGSLLAYRDAGAARVAGVEVDADAARFAALRVAELPDAEVRCYDGERLPFPDAAFDVVESMDVIEHTACPEGYLAELARVLAPGGLILLVTPNRLWPVEQHLGVLGPPWLPVDLADRVFAALAGLPGLSQDRRYRYRKLAIMRAHNLSPRRLRALAHRHRLHLRVLPRLEFPDSVWPLPREPRWLERLAAHRYGWLVAPVRTLAVTLEHRPR